MRFAIILFVVASTAGCSTVECGPGTIERNGTCEPPDGMSDPAGCGSGTVLVGDQCVTTVACDPDTTMEVPDPSDPSKTVCVGTAGGNQACGQPLNNCKTPAAGKQTICGQLYNVEDNTPFEVPGADGSMCDGTAATGPCALKVTPYDAYEFANSPSTATPLANGGTYIDNCGRYQIKDIAQPSSPFIGLGFDDANAANMGANGVTNTTGVAATASPDAKTQNLEAWVAPKSTTDMWASSGGPPVSGGIYVAIFRTHKCDADGKNCNGDGDPFATQSGVTITLSGSPLTNNDYYFMANETARQTIDGSATATGVNGTGLLTGASVTNSINYSGTGGITDTTNCKWEGHAAASLPTIVFFQVYRPQNQIGKQCAQ